MALQDFKSPVIQHTALVSIIYFSYTTATAHSCLWTLHRGIRDQLGFSWTGLEVGTLTPAGLEVE